MLDDDTADTLHERIKEVERRKLPGAAPSAPHRRRRRMSPRALISVYDKRGLTEFAAGLHAARLRARRVRQHGRFAAARPTSRSSPSRRSPAHPRCSKGRVKTLHPRIHGGLLADLGNPTHRADLDAQGIEPFDLVVSNLYPFLSTPSIETIDIGGPAMVRAAAKNHAWVGVVTSPDQYDDVLAELRAGDGALSAETRRRLAREGVRTHRDLRRRDRQLAGGRRAAPRAPRLVPRTHRGRAPLRREPAPASGPRTALPAPRPGGTQMHQHSGLALSYLNFYDTDAAWRIVHDLATRPTVRHHQARQPVRRRGRGRSRDGLPARARMRRPVRVRRDRRAEPSAGPGDRRAHGRRPPGRRRHRPRLRRRHDRGADREAQEHPPARRAATRAGRRSTPARSPAGS